MRSGPTRPYRERGFYTLDTSFWAKSFTRLSLDTNTITSCELCDQILSRQLSMLGFSRRKRPAFGCWLSQRTTVASAETNDPEFLALQYAPSFRGPLILSRDDTVPWWSWKCRGIRFDAGHTTIGGDIDVTSFCLTQFKTRGALHRRLNSCYWQTKKKCSAGLSPLLEDTSTSQKIQANQSAPRLTSC